MGTLPTTISGAPVRLAIALICLTDFQVPEGVFTMVATAPVLSTSLGKRGQRARLRLR